MQLEQRVLRSFTPLCYASRPLRSPTKSWHRRFIAWNSFGKGMNTRVGISSSSDTTVMILLGHALALIDTLHLNSAPSAYVKHEHFSSSRLRW